KYFSSNTLMDLTNGRKKILPNSFPQIVEKSTTYPQVVNKLYRSNYPSRSIFTNKNTQQLS
ncbi:hypothetical protein, partial [Streptococcus suis]|uniref:hypothetical protein n=1 Tax=Streptococcus suis TaxID=1307 RepID=UPI001E2B4CF8